MSISSYYDNLINSSNEFISEKQDENTLLENQEKQLDESLKAEKIRARKLEKALSSLKDKMNIFLRENGGIFSLNKKQEKYYLEMLDEHSVLSTKWSNTRSLTRNLTHNIVGINNRMQSNYLSIFNETLDIGEYQNEKALFTKVSGELA